MAMNKITYQNDKVIEKFGNISAQYIPNYITPLLLEQLSKFLSSAEPIYKGLNTVPYVRVSYQKFAKLRFTPRFTWCYGQYNGESLASYRGQGFQTELIPQWLLDIKMPIEKYLGVDFNAVILNKYENGEDYISWHQDDEEFLEHHLIASISIGAERDFQMRTDKNETIHEIKLQSGSLIIFNGVLHSLPKRMKVSGVRFNITFRKVKSNHGIGNYYYYNRGILTT